MIPVIALVGRPNVGKSSLLNALARRRISIVDPVPGVTRDRVSVSMETSEGRAYELVDTGGIGIVDRQDLGDHVEEQVMVALGMADLVCFVVDARTGPHALDQRVAEELRKRNLPVIVLANKADAEKFDPEAAEFYALGFDDVLPVSAEQRRNLAELLDRFDAFIAALPDAEDADASADPTLKLAIIGKRNAGKSTLVNALAQEHRVIVSETPGATRDAIDVKFRFRDQTFIAIDTAGMRRKQSVQNSIEFYAQARAYGAIRRADVVLLLLDTLTDTSIVDRKLADDIVRAAKPCIIGVNKWDLAGDVTTEKYAEYVHGKLPGLSFAPLSFLSAQSGSNVWQTIALAHELHTQAGTRVGTGKLNRALERALDKRRPPIVKGARPKVFYGTQVDVHPPTIVLFVNKPGYFDKNYRRYLANQFRDQLPYSEVPLRLKFKAREKIQLSSG